MFNFFNLNSIKFQESDFQIGFVFSTAPEAEGLEAEALDAVEE